MAARTTSGPKKAAGATAARKGARSSARNTQPAGRDAETARARKALPLLPKSTGIAKAAQPGKARQKSSKKTATSGDAAADSDALEMLTEQNEALRAELEQAHARIRQLEDLNRNVVDRIDWVIDSLQSILPSR